MKLFVGNLLECVEYLVEEIDTHRRRNDDEAFSAGYRIVKPIAKLKEEKVLLIKLSNGKYLRYTDTMGLNNILNRLRLYQSDGPRVLEEQGYIIRDKATKQGDIFVDPSSLVEFKSSSKSAKKFVKKRKESK